MYWIIGVALGLVIIAGSITYYLKHCMKKISAFFR